MKYCKPIAIAFALLSCTACSTASSDSYPSLAIRDVERAEGTYNPVPAAPLDIPPVAVSMDGGLSETLSALVAQAGTAHGRFLAAVPAARADIVKGSGAEPGSDRWVDALMALSDLDSARALTALPLSELDILHAATTVQAEDASEIEAARSQVTSRLEEADSILSDLNRQFEAAR